MLSPRFRQRNGTRDVSLARELLLGIQAAGVPTYRQTIPAIAAELRRCRRYERPLTVLTVALEGPDLPPDAAAELSVPQPPLQSGLDCMLFLLLGTLLRDVTRESDLVTYAAEEHVYALFLTEAAQEAASLAATRLARALHERAGVRIRAGIAEFPGHGLTVESLFDHAISVMADSQPVPLELPAPADGGAPPSQAQDHKANGPEETEWRNLRSAR